MPPVPQQIRPYWEMIKGSWLLTTPRNSRRLFLGENKGTIGGLDPIDSHDEKQLNQKPGYLPFFSGIPQSPVDQTSRMVFCGWSMDQGFPILPARAKVWSFWTSWGMKLPSYTMLHRDYDKPLLGSHHKLNQPAFKGMAAKGQAATWTLPMSPGMAMQFASRCSWMRRRRSYPMQLEVLVPLRRWQQNTMRRWKVGYTPLINQLDGIYQEKGGLSMATLVSTGYL